MIVKTGLAPDWTRLGFSYEGALAAVNMALSGGGIVGGAIVSLWGGAKRHRIEVLLVTILLGALGQMFMGLSPWLYGTMLGAGAIAFTGPFGNAHSQAIWQSQVPRELQGRVFGVRRTMSQGVVPLGVMLSGWLCSVVSAGVAMALLGGVVALVSIIALCSPLLRRVEDTEYLDRLAREAV
jgi:predicted MFS family arabinose efflux permease